MLTESKMAMGDIITLVTGPSGTGKEIVAKAIGCSRFIPYYERKGQLVADFVRFYHGVNLSALSPTLMESELFGHRKGAFTGALADRSGYFEVCGQYGTVFLDEIGEVDASVQVKLLRVLQTRQYQRLGDTQTLSFKGKVMAATNRNLADEIAQGRFKEDLYYRLCADKVETLALRDIVQCDEAELAVLVAYVLERILGTAESASMLDSVMSVIVKGVGLHYAWPGNFRELEQCVRNIIVHGEYTGVGLIGSKTADSVVDCLAQHPLKLDTLIGRYVKAVYVRHGKNYELTGRRLGVDRRTVKKYVLSSPESLTETDS